MKRILHVCIDEKFIDFAITNFRSIDYVESDFVVISNTEKLKYIKSENITVKSKQTFLINIFFGYLKKYEAVVFHSMQDMFKFFIKFFPKNKKVCWIGFGFDYYDYSQILPGREVVKKGMKYFIKNKILNLDTSYQRINYFCPVLESEFESVALRLKLDAKYIDWNYGSSDNIVEKLKGDYVNGDSILLGNSASETNNHLEVIDELVKINEKREVIIPLSYGDSKYADMIIAKLKSTSLNYTVLRDFLTQDEYFNILKRCAFVIMNHKRQQAAGNILIMLSLGAKVILDKENPLYDYFTSIGFDVFEKVNLKNGLSKKLIKREALFNKCVAINNFNDDVTNQKTKNLVNTLTNINEVQVKFK